MKIILSFSLIFSVLSVSAQKLISSAKASDHSTYVKGDNFEGVIFSNKYQAGYYVTDYKTEKFTPSLNDILQVEKLINEDKNIVKDAFIRKNLKKYLRQYAGYVIKNRQKIIFVNLFWKDEILDQEKLHRELPKVLAPQWEEYWYHVADGWYFYWRIKVNLSTKKLFDFEENGIG